MKRRLTNINFKKNRRRLPVLLFLVLVFSGIGCNRLNDPLDDETDDFELKSPSHVTLLYAVNRSSLWRDYAMDVAEIEKALNQIKDPYGRFLVYCTDESRENCHLYEAVRLKNGEFKLAGAVIMDYPYDVPSTHPQRMKEVVDKALSLYPDAKYSLFFWGHGSSWSPSDGNHQLVANPADLPQSQSYGGEYTGSFGDWKNTDWTEITEIAEVLPDNAFEYIWFDCCYMAGIETIYELRGKCRQLVVYPTEVWEYGLPYDLVLPHVFNDNPDLIEGARELFNYYDRTGDPVTVSVVDMSAVEEVASAASDIMSSDSISLPLAKESLRNVDDYARTPNGPFYDFMAYMKVASETGACPELMASLETAYGKMVPYHAESAVNFNRRYWSGSLSGISMHNYDAGGKDAAFYRSLAWYKRVFETKKDKGMPIAE